MRYFSLVIITALEQSITIHLLIEGIGILFNVIKRLPAQDR